MGSKASLDLGEAEGLPGLRENAAEPVPWEGRASQESQGPREEWGAMALVGRRAMTGETEWAAKVVEAEKGKEDSPGTQDRRAHRASLG